MKKLISFVFVLPLFLFAQSDITGNWTGVLYQEPDVPGGEKWKFKFSMNIKQENGKIKGTSTILTGPSFGIIQFNGTFKNGVFSFEEYKISDEKPMEGRVWCFKSGKLQMKKAGDKLKLEGPWEGYAKQGGITRACNPGTIELTKEQGFISLKGFVVDEKTTLAIPAMIRITDKKTNKEVTNLKTRSGEFDVKLSPDHLYELTVESKGYLTKFETVNLTSSQVLNFALTAVEIGQVVKLKNLLFTQGTIMLTEDSYPELDRLKKFLADNPGVKIELQGHTSNEGEVSRNIDLSDRRTKTIKDYLVENGIDESRIATKAFGPNKPIVPNDTEENRKLNRRVEFLILNK